MSSRPSWPRREYDGKPLDVGDVPADAMEAAALWYEEAVAWFAGWAGDQLHGNEAALGTATKDGVPSVRIVLIRGVDPEGVVFFTNRRSRKGRELLDNPVAALTLYWPGLSRQVRFEGRTEVVDEAISQAYHEGRPRGSQLSAAASQQSAPIASREALVARRDAVEAATRGGPVPRPEGWGGFRLVPSTVELWQGRPDRLHDRLLYERQADGAWALSRLQP